MAAVPRDGRGPGLHPPAGRHPPRPQAGQHLPRLGRPRQDRRLWTGHVVQGLARWVNLSGRVPAGCSDEFRGFLSVGCSFWDEIELLTVSFGFERAASKDSSSGRVSRADLHRVATNVADGQFWLLEQPPRTRWTRPKAGPAARSGSWPPAAATWRRAASPARSAPPSTSRPK